MKYTIRDPNKVLIYIFNILCFGLLIISSSVWQPDYLDGVAEKLIENTSLEDYVYGEIITETPLEEANENAYNAISYSNPSHPSISKITGEINLCVTLGGVDYLLFDDAVFANTIVDSFEGREALTMQGDMILDVFYERLSSVDTNLETNEIIVPDSLFSLATLSGYSKEEIIQNGEFYIKANNSYTPVEIAAAYECDTPPGNLLNTYQNQTILLGNALLADSAGLHFEKYLTRFENNPNPFSEDDFWKANTRFFRLLGGLLAKTGGNLVFTEATVPNEETFLNEMNFYVNQISGRISNPFRKASGCCFLVLALLFCILEIYLFITADMHKYGLLKNTCFYLSAPLITILLLFGLDKAIPFAVSNIGLLYSCLIYIVTFISILIIGGLKAKKPLLKMEDIYLKI